MRFLRPLPLLHPSLTLTLPLRPTLQIPSRHSSSTSSSHLPPRPKPPPETEIHESFLKGSGPGGQKINKTNSAVQLKHLPTGIVVKSQATRSREQNRKIARNLLAQRLDELANGNQSRSAVVGDVKRRKAASAAKKSRRKYRKLAAGEETEGAPGLAGLVGEAGLQTEPDVHKDTTINEVPTSPSRV